MLAFSVNMMYNVYNYNVWRVDKYNGYASKENDRTRYF